MNYKGSTYTTEERIKLAGDEKKDRLYEPKQNQKAIKVLTVAAYVLCVSLAAIMLSFYYIFIWNSSTKPNMIQPRAITCDKIVIPDGLEKLLANASEISLETFLKNYSMRFKLDHEKIKMIQIQEIKHFPHLFERLEQQQAATLANSNNNNKEQGIDLLASTTPMSLTATEQPFSELVTSLPGSSLFLSDSPIVSGSSSSSLPSPSGLLLKKLKEINRDQTNRNENASNKNIEIDDRGGDADDGENGDEDDDDDDEDDEDDTEQEDYYEPSGQKEIAEKFNINKTAKIFN